jgi:hypothetical protein
MSETFALLASIATAIGVFFAWWQIRRGTVQAVTDFEDGLAREYRELARCIPVKALLNEELTEAEFADTLPYFFRYIDLSNEQIFLRKVGRVRKQTWFFWRDGIRSNLGRPSFKKAWDYIKERSQNNFEELRSLERGHFEEDPHDWK